MKFLDQIIQRAKENKQTIVLPESLDERTIVATEIICKKEIANVILVGDEKEILDRAKGHDISKATIIDPKTSSHYNDFVDSFFEMRQKKGVTMEQAKATLLDPLYFGVMLVKKGIAHGMVAGACHSTADTLRPALQILKTAPGTKLVSAFFVMVVPDCEFGYNGTFVYGDSGLVENPDAEKLSEIAISSANSFKTLVMAEPKVAMLSYSTKGSAKVNELTQKVITATNLVHEKAPSLAIDGELQADAALVPHIAKSKAPGSDVAGNANVLIFPDLNCGNIAYKLTQRLAKAEAYGPITQGIARPVNDLSRGCSAEDIVGVVAITAVQAQNM